MIYEPETESSIASEKPVNNTAAFLEKNPETSEQRIQLTNTKVEVRDPNYKWAGKTPLDLLETYAEAIKKADENTSEEALEERIKRFLIGFWGERALANVPVDKARTVYAAEDATPEDYLDYKVKDVETVVGVTRKDILIRGYYLAQIEGNKDLLHQVHEEYLAGNNPDINVDDALEVINVQLRVMKRYDRAVEVWQEDTRQSKFPNMGELMTWAIKDEIAMQHNDRKGVWRNLNDRDQIANIVTWSNFLIEQQNTLIFHEKDPNVVVKTAAKFFARDEELATQLQKQEQAKGNPEEEETMAKRVKHYKSAWEPVRKAANKYGDSYYYDINIPDAILVNQQGQPEGIMEIKCYTTEEVRLWVDALRNTLNSDLPMAHAGLEGLQTYAYVKPNEGFEQSPLQVGFNPDANARFLNMIEGTHPSDLRNIRENRRMVLRFTDDIPDELIQQLGDTMQELGYKDFIIQKVGLEEVDIRKMAQVMTKRDLPKVAAAANPDSMRIMQRLTGESAWVEKN